jgi:DNA-binding MarR family transcriptional regulator
MTTLRRTERTLAAALDAALSDVGITAAQFHALEELTVTTVVHVGELAWRHRVTRQSMHGIVRNLADAGLVELAPREHGVRNLWPTTSGSELVILAR